MVREIKVDESYQTTKVFDEMKVGDISKVPYDKNRHTGIKSEASRRNRDARLIKKLKNKMDIRFRVSSVEYPGYSTIMRVK